MSDVDHFTVTARGPNQELRTAEIRMRYDDQRSLNEVAELEFAERYGVTGWTLVHNYWHNAPAGTLQTRYFRP